MPDEARKAGLLLRVIAKALDFIIVAAMAEVVPKAGFYAGISYLLISDGLFNGRSLGKRLIGLRVTSIAADSSDGPCSMKQSIIRNAPFGAGFLLNILPWIGWIFIVFISTLEFLILLGSKEGMRFGDEIAKTAVLEDIKNKTGQEAQ